MLVESTGDDLQSGFESLSSFVLSNVLDFMTLEHACVVALVSKSFHEAFKYKGLHWRVNVDYLSSISCEMFAGGRRAAAGRKTTAWNGMGWTEWKENAEAFLGDCQRVKHLDLPFWSGRVVSLLGSLEGGGLSTLRVAQSCGKEGYRYRKLIKKEGFEAEEEAMGKAMERQEDLWKLEWRFDGTPTNLSLYGGTFSRLVELNLSRFAGEIQLLDPSGGVSEMRRLTWGPEDRVNPNRDSDNPNAVSIYNFVEQFSLLNLSELNVSGTRFGDRCFKGTEEMVNMMEGKKGGRDWKNKELRVKASLTSDCGTGKVDVICGMCHNVLIPAVSSFLLSPEFTPETGEVTVMHFDGEFETEGLMENEDGAWICGNHHGEEVKTGWGVHHKSNERRNDQGGGMNTHLPMQRGYNWTVVPGKNMQCYFEDSAGNYFFD